MLSREKQAFPRQGAASALGQPEMTEIELESQAIYMANHSKSQGLFVTQNPLVNFTSSFQP